MTREQAIDEAVRRVALINSNYIMPQNQMRWLLKQPEINVLGHVRREFRRIIAGPENQLS